MTLLNPPDLARAASALEGAHPGEVLGWAADRFGDGLVVTASFGDPTLVHLVASTLPGTPITLLDTQYLFAETLWYADHLQQRFGFPLQVVHPAPGVDRDDRWRDDVDGCCGVRKVEPLRRALAGRSAWVTGLRRDDDHGRADTPVVAWDAGKGIVKVNPLASWTDDDVALYAHLHDLPAHPLADRGYASIGCWPCTRPIGPGEDRRSGRWAGRAKTECGLHA